MARGAQVRVGLAGSRHVRLGPKRDKLGGVDFDQTRADVIAAAGETRDEPCATVG